MLYMLLNISSFLRPVSLCRISLSHVFISITARTARNIKRKTRLIRWLISANFKKVISLLKNSNIFVYFPTSFVYFPIILFGVTANKMF